MLGRLVTIAAAAYGGVMLAKNRCAWSTGRWVGKNASAARWPP